MAKANALLAVPDENCAPKFNCSSGFLWRHKRDKKKHKRSQTAGKPNCQASTLDRYMCSRSRSYKHKNYAAWSEGITKRNN
jgi:hypothetical protein